MQLPVPYVKVIIWYPSPAKAGLNRSPIIPSPDKTPPVLGKVEINIFESIKQ